jgi:hypothetical protein
MEYAIRILILGATEPQRATKTMNSTEAAEWSYNFSKLLLLGGVEHLNTFS